MWPWGPKAWKRCMVVAPFPSRWTSDSKGFERGSLQLSIGRTGLDPCFNYTFLEKIFDRRPTFAHRSKFMGRSSFLFLMIQPCSSFLKVKPQSQSCSSWHSELRLLDLRYQQTLKHIDYQRDFCCWYWPWTSCHQRSLPGTVHLPRYNLNLRLSV